MSMESKLPPTNIPVIWCDFNACGLSGDVGDNCYYSLHRERLTELNPTEGTTVFIYDDDLDDCGKPEVFGCVATLEKIAGFTSEWRARPDESTWYRGPAQW